MKTRTLILALLALPLFIQATEKGNLPADLVERAVRTKAPRWKFVE